MAAGDTKILMKAIKDYRRLALDLSRANRKRAAHDASVIEKMRDALEDVQGCLKAAHETNALLTEKINRLTKAKVIKAGS